MALVPARFAGRPHRFAVEAELRDGSVVEAHLADPGRLLALLRPGAELRLRPAPAGTARKTRFTAALVRAAGSGVWVSLEAMRANGLAESLIDAGTLPGVEGGSLRREVRSGASRFDFVLENPGRRCWIEVKSVTWVDEGAGWFPDAPTTRGRRHVEELTALRRGGDDAMVLFIAQRGDARDVRPSAEIDPAFATALAGARDAGVRLEAAGFEFGASGRARFAGLLPVRAP